MYCASHVSQKNIQDLIDYLHIDTSDDNLMQELMSVNIGFYDHANDCNKEIFLEAALDSIIEITKKGDSIYVIETEMCYIEYQKNSKTAELCNYELNCYCPVRNLFYNDIIKQIVEKYEIENNIENR